MRVCSLFARELCAHLFGNFVRICSATLRASVRAGVSLFERAGVSLFEREGVLRFEREVVLRFDTTFCEQIRMLSSLR